MDLMEAAPLRRGLGIEALAFNDGRGMRMGSNDVSKVKGGGGPEGRNLVTSNLLSMYVVTGALVL